MYVCECMRTQHQTDTAKGNTVNGPSIYEYSGSEIPCRWREQCAYNGDVGTRVGNFRVMFMHWKWNFGNYRDSHRTIQDKFVCTYKNMKKVKISFFCGTTDAKLLGLVLCRMLWVW